MSLNESAQGQCHVWQRIIEENLYWMDDKWLKQYVDTSKDESGKTSHINAVAPGNKQ